MYTINTVLDIKGGPTSPAARETASFRIILVFDASGVSDIWYTQLPGDSEVMEGRRYRRVNIFPAIKRAIISAA